VRSGEGLRGVCLCGEAGLGAPLGRGEVRRGWVSLRLLVRGAVPAGAWRWEPAAPGRLVLAVRGGRGEAAREGPALRVCGEAARVSACFELALR